MLCFSCQFFSGEDVNGLTCAVNPSFGGVGGCPSYELKARWLLQEVFLGKRAVVKRTDKQLFAVVFFNEDKVIFNRNGFKRVMVGPKARALADKLYQLGIE